MKKKNKKKKRRNIDLYFYLISIEKDISLIKHLDNSYN